jgi:hypothetical protein
MESREKFFIYLLRVYRVRNTCEFGLEWMKINDGTNIPGMQRSSPLFNR